MPIGYTRIEYNSRDCDMIFCFRTLEDCYTLGERSSSRY